MSADFRDVMRGQFEDGQRRLADDPFVTASGGSVVGRVRRKRAINNVAVGGGTMLAAGALIVAAMQVPFGTATPATSPSGCVTSTPAPDPFPVTTATPDATGRSFDVELPGGSGTMALTLTSDASNTLAVAFPDGSTTTVAPEGNHGYFIFEMPNGAPAVAVIDFRGDLKVSVGDVNATVVPATETSTPRVVYSPGPLSVNCGGQPDDMAGSPFECGFPLTGVVHEDDALEIANSGYKTVAEARTLMGDATFAVINPVASLGDPVLPFVTVVNHENTTPSLNVGRDPDAGVVHRNPGGDTGVSVVKVLDGKVVAVTNLEDPNPGDPIRGSGFGGSEMTVLISDDTFFAACPGVTSTAGASLFAIAGSQTWDRQQAGEPGKYVWQKLPGAAD